MTGFDESKPLHFFGSTDDATSRLVTARCGAIVNVTTTTTHPEDVSCQACQMRMSGRVPDAPAPVPPAGGGEDETSSKVLHALELAQGGLKFLLDAKLSGSDHPGATKYVLSYVEGAIRALRTNPPVQEWRDIASAPKDGTAVLLCCADWEPAKFRSEPAPRKVGGWNKERSEWHIFGASWTPTHWMPLPVPPGALQRDGGK